MKFIPLIWAMLWRKKIRTFFTLLSITIAFLLFGILQGINTAFQQTMQRSNVDRLIVSSRISLIQSLPYADKTRIEAVPGVTRVSHESWFGAFFQDPRNSFAAFPVEADQEFAIRPELKVPKLQLEALLHTRTGAIVGLDLAKRYNWKIGDQISLHSTIWTKTDGTSDWTFNIVGIFEDPTDRWMESGFYFNYAYFDEARSFDKGKVGWYVVQVKDPAQSALVADAIDKLFANSSDETKTQTEKEFQQAFLKQLGDINLIVTYILFAVFFALLFSTGSTLIQAARERVPELAILKTLGYSDNMVLLMVLSESLALCFFAALLGFGIAEIMFSSLKDIIGLGSFPLPVAIEGLFMAAALAIITSIVPAWRAKRLAIVEALR
jgi:putative ABC transport system permease protein